MSAKHSFIPYDIRNDSIPFEANTVKAVYCSHVIEHIEDNYVQAFFADVYRVLMPGGVFRIACPDAEFLYNVSKCENEYWHWRKEWFESPKFYTKNPSEVQQADYLVRETATPSLQGYVNANPKDYYGAFSSMGMDEFLRYITSGLEYRKDFPGDHINYWTFDKVKAVLESAGFPAVVRSKYAGSMCKAMCILGKFDTTYPEMSLYAEAVK
ncbi:MAG: methyltransferase domain-containing protein [Synergistaceae bacterium]|nr:methyltransferase domain-containing protein [Synergistaceae bacterium]